MATFRPGDTIVAVGVPVLFVALSVILTSCSPATTSAPTDGDTSTVTSESSIVATPDPQESESVAPGMGEPSIGAEPDMLANIDRPSTKKGKVRVSYSVKTKDPVAFITIDDGVNVPDDALAFVQQQQLPVTAFLTTWTIGGKKDYFEAITKWGSIQNHSVNHASFAESDTNLNTEICKAQRILKKDFGARPWMLRPPYGAAADDTQVKKVAKSCGIHQIVMWDASVNRGRVVPARGELRPGSIVLLHFRPELKKDLKATVKAIEEAGLKPANLADYLPKKG